MIPNIPITSTGQPFPLPPAYIFDRSIAAYRDQRTGQIIPPEKIMEVLAKNEQINAEIMGGISSALLKKDDQSGSWTGWLGAAWLLIMQMLLRRMHVQNAALGAGGYDQISQDDWLRIQRTVKDDIDRLVRFGQEIENGDLSEAQINARINLYIGTARATYWLAQAIPHVEKDETIIERRRMTPADHCEWCVYLEDVGWQPVGILPAPGVFVDGWDDGCCGSNCHCRKERKIIKRSDLDRYVTETLESKYRT